MPKFKASREQNVHIESIGASYRFNSKPDQNVIDCEFLDSEKNVVAVGVGNNHFEAFEAGYAKIAGLDKPKTKAELAAELAAAKAELARVRAGTAAESTTEEPKRGRGRPPGSKNKQTDEGAGPNPIPGDDSPDA